MKLRAARPGVLVAAVFLMLLLGHSTLLIAGDCAAARGANPTCDIKIDRETPSSPLSIRMDRNATANITVSKRPLEKIQFDATYADVAQPDPFVTIFSSFITPLKAVTIGVSLSGNPTGRLGSFLRTKPALGPWQPILDELGGIEIDQDGAGTNLTTVKAAADTAGTDLKGLQKIPPDPANSGLLETTRVKVLCEMVAGEALGDTRLPHGPDRSGGSAGGGRHDYCPR
jgi:hypothetical protein